MFEAYTAHLCNLFLQDTLQQTCLCEDTLDMRIPSKSL